ncbi:galanin receptor 2a-like [Amphiura filiformis]|uniref:galanin receptor 2a-like n=1 Tax=Amphiura filiformis TaxID=82378 RepID=UPI003B21F7E6
MDNDSDVSERPIHTWNKVVWNWNTSLQLVLAIIGIMGNALVIAVYVRRKEMRNKTGTFILHLAIADLMTSVAIIPLPTIVDVGTGYIGTIYCKVIHTNVVLWISIVASVFLLTTLSGERFLAVAYPLKYRIVFTQKRTYYVISGVWFVAVLLNTNSFYLGVNDNGICRIRYLEQSFQIVQGAGIFLIEFAIPLIIMISANIATAQELKSQAKNLLARNESRDGPAFSLLRTRKKVIEMLAIVVISFTLCWTPDQVCYFLYNIGALPTNFLYGHVYRTLVLLAFCNSCGNPFIYASKNKKFRTGFQAMLPSFRSNKVGPVLPTSSRQSARENQVYSTQLQNGPGHSCIPPR